MEKFKEIFESRASLKKAYMNPGYTIKDVEKVFKKGNAYVQYPDKRSRGGIGSGYIVDIKGDEIEVESKFGDNMIISADEITMLDNVKR